MAKQTVAMTIMMMEDGQATMVLMIMTMAMVLMMMTMMIMETKTIIEDVAAVDDAEH